LAGVDEEVDTLRRAGRHGDADAPRRPRQAVAGELAPVVAAVGGLPQAAARAVRRRVDVPGWPPRLPERGVDRPRIAGLEGEVDRASVLVRAENLFPVRAAVARAEHAALSVGPVGVAEGGDVDEVGVRRIDEDAADLLAVAEPGVDPGAAAVGGLVHAVALRDV